MAPFILFFIVLFLYSIFSYALVDPNLVLTSNDLYWSFQNWMWSNLFSNGELMAYVYFGIVVSLFILYFHILNNLKSKKNSLNHVFKTKHILIFIVIISPLLFSYNALSHDVFNYIFNAKMVVEYGADPHLQTALEFSDDLWVRFMHNTHTPAPYGRGWTYLSLIPFMLGFGKFTLSLLSFRVWSLLSVFLLYFAMQRLSKALLERKLNFYELALVFLNPLFLIEVISNYHNDLWMMSFAILGISFLVAPMNDSFDSKKKKIFLVGSVVFLGASIWIKLASIALVPIWLLVIGSNITSFGFSNKLAEKIKINSGFLNNFLQKLFMLFVNGLIKYIPDIAALLMFLPLFTSRSQQFLPWYALWILVWIPFMKLKIFRNLIVVFTLSSGLRYLPWLANNMDFTDQIITNQKIITWMIPIIYLFTNLRKRFNLEKK